MSLHEKKQLGISEDCVIIHLYDYSTMWTLVASLAEQLTREGKTVAVVRVKSKAYGSSHSLQTIAQRWLNKSGALDRKLDEIGARLVDFNVSKYRKMRSDLPPKELDALRFFAKGQAITILRDSSQLVSKTLGKLLALRLYKASLPFVFLGRKLSEEKDVGSVFIPNGRMVSEAALGLGLPEKRKIHFYEGSLFYSRGYVANHPPQDNRSHAQHFTELGMSEKNQAGITRARDWISERTTSKNLFYPKNPKEIELRQENKVSISYFSSSDDEYDHLPPEWGFGTGLTNQWSQLVNYLEGHWKGIDFQLTIRVHPNFLNKGFVQGLSEIRKISQIKKRYPATRVIGPGSQIDTYSLIEHSDLILTHGSTVGLEAACMGKYIHNLSPTFYDLALEGCLFSLGSETETESTKKFSTQVSFANSQKLGAYFNSVYSESFPLGANREYFWSKDPEIPGLGIRLSWIPTGFSLWSLVSFLLRFPTKILVLCWPLYLPQTPDKSGRNKQHSK